MEFSSERSPLAPTAVSRSIALQPRLFTLDQAAVYTSLPKAEVKRLRLGLVRLGAHSRYDKSAIDAELGPGSSSGLAGLRFHDFRGTAATNFVRAGLTIEEVALILGWNKRKVEQIAVRYVTGEAIGAGMVERLRQNKTRINL
jgi:hypothetical protein